MRVDDLPARGERRDAIDQGWIELLDGLGYQPVLIPNRVAELAGYLRALAIDGLILTGGNDLPGLAGARDPAPERDHTERELLRLSAAHDWPLLGVCRGMQLLVQEAGGHLAELPHHVRTLHPVEMVGDQPWLGHGARVVNSFHRFGVPADGLGTELEAAALSPEGWVEAVRHRTLRQWGILWHPERAPHTARDVELLGALFAEVAA